MRIGQCAICVVAAGLLGPANSVYAAPMGTAFTYQGQLKQGDVLVESACDFEFSLWDAESGGGQIPPMLPVTVPADEMNDGLFTATLDFGTGAFDGDARWLDIRVSCPPGASFVPLGRQELTPAPYAMHAPGAAPLWTLTTGNNIYAKNGGNVGIGTKSPEALLSIQADQDVTEYLHLSGFDNDTGPTRPVMKFRRGRGSEAVPGLVENGDTLGSILAAGHDGTEFQNLAAIEFIVDGQPDSGEISGRIEFDTAPDGDTFRQTRMTINNNGNVGIGTPEPRDKLDVKGNIRSSNPNTEDAVVILGWSQDAAGDDMARIRIGGISAGSANGLDIQRQGSVSLMRLLNNGNVGIGTTAPSEKLDVNGALKLRSPQGGGDWKFGSSSIGDLLLLDSESESNPLIVKNGAPNNTFRISAAGNVGIGASPPTKKLDVAGDGKFTGGDVSVWFGNKAVTLRQDSNDTYLANMANFVSNGSESNGKLYLNGEGGVRLNYGSAGSSGTTGLALNSDGNVGIGTGDTAGYRLNVNGPVNATDLLINGASVGGGLTLPYSGNVDTPNDAFAVTNTGLPGMNAPRALVGKVTYGGGAVGVYGEATSATGYGGHFRNTAGGTALRVSGKLKVGIFGPSGDATLQVRGEEDRPALMLSNATHDALEVKVTTGFGTNFRMLTPSGTETIRLYSGKDASLNPKLELYSTTGTRKIVLNGNSGNTRTRTLTITGGSDLSEQFDVSPSGGELKPGQVLCIDPEHPGKLVVSTRPYDRRVAGVLSGAGGVNPGMLMGQQGTAADGAHPVALSGRVYVLADASNGPIEPGDLLTTSGAPGHAMKVTDHHKAQGAVIGKAMTALSEGEGLVLVLVSLQ